MCERLIFSFLCSFSVDGFDCFSPLFAPLIEPMNTFSAFVSRFFASSLGWAQITSIVKVMWCLPMERERSAELSDEMCYSFWHKSAFALTRNRKREFDDAGKFADLQGIFTCFKAEVLRWNFYGSGWSLGNIPWFLWNSLNHAHQMRRKSSRNFPKLNPKSINFPIEFFWSFHATNASFEPVIIPSGRYCRSIGNVWQTWNLSCHVLRAAIPSQMILNVVEGGETTDWEGRPRHLPSDKCPECL